MNNPPKSPGRPKTSPLTREEQLRSAKRAQRQRERKAGLATVQLRLPHNQAKRLRVAVKIPHFQQDMERLLQDTVLDINQWPMLKDLAWNRNNHWIPAAEAFGLYERNWRFIDPDNLTKDEACLISQLKDRFGNGLLNV